MTRHPLLLPSQPRLRRRLAVSAPLTLAGLSLLIAACGGGASPSSVASMAKTTSTTVAGADAGGTAPANPTDQAKHYQQALKLSQCMRAHGVTDFPDPSASGGIRMSSNGPSSDLNPDNSTFSAAQKACQRYRFQPSPQQQAQAQANALAFAACMRKSGVPNFADPQFLSGGRIEEKITSGVDPNSPTFQAAQQKCSGNGGGRPGAPVRAATAATPN
jgi:hypothetical protein